MNLLPLLAGLLVTSFSLAQSDKTPTVYINGTPIKGTLVTVGGKSFVQLPLSDLQKSGALVSGGSAPVKAIQGCLGQPLFNGVTRITLTSAGLNKAGKYEIGFRVANGTQKTFSPSTEADAMYASMYAASDDGQVMQFTVPDGYTSADTGNIQLTPGANVLERAVLNEAPSFTVTRILYRPGADTLKEGRLSGLPFAPVSAMEFALKCK